MLVSGHPQRRVLLYFQVISFNRGEIWNVIRFYGAFPMPENVLDTLYLFSRIQLFATIWTAACQAFLFFTISWSFLKLMSTESVMPSNHLILCHPLLLLLSVFAIIRVFSSELTLCIKWPKYWSFSFSISLSSEYSGLISFRIDWFDLLAVQGTLQSLLQHHSYTY